MMTSSHKLAQWLQLVVVVAATASGAFPSFISRCSYLDELIHQHSNIINSNNNHQQHSHHNCINNNWYSSNDNNKYNYQYNDSNSSNNNSSNNSNSTSNNVSSKCSSKWSSKCSTSVLQDTKSCSREAFCLDSCLGQECLWRPFACARRARARARARAAER